MIFKCPYCSTEVNLRSGVCEKAHRFPLKNRVLTLFTEEYDRKYSPFEKKFQVYRDNKSLRILDSKVYDSLPFVSDKKHPGNWKPKQIDFKLICKLLGDRKGQEVLDWGAWNGWLSHRLAARGNKVYSVAYFSDSYDGLGAIDHYTNSDWLPVQMDMERYDLLDGKLDAIIVNRNLNYMSDPVGFLKSMKSLIANGGMIICTGVMVARNKRMADEEFENNMKEFEVKNGFSLRHKEFYGALSKADLNSIKQLGFQIKNYKVFKNPLKKGNVSTRWFIHQRKP